MSAEDEAVIWVYFQDKGPSAEQKLITAQQALRNGINTEALVSERSYNRRRKNLGLDRSVEMQDIPLNRNYVDAIARIVTKIRHEASWFNAVSVVATKEQISRLQQLPFVANLEIVRRFSKRLPDIEIESELSPPSPTSIPQSPTLLNYGSSLTQNNQINVVAVHNLGINGSGVLIGIFDAGFSNLTHPALATRPIVARYDFVTNSPVLGSHSHGENTFSVVGGFSDGNLIGPAYGASFVLARTEDATPETPIEEDNWVRAIIWADSIGIDVASTSLGYNDFDPPWPDYLWQDLNGTTSIMTRAADRAVALGIVVVNSAGNGGTISLPANTLGAPADGFNVLAAGAVTSSGTRSSFSSVGPSADGRIKPDIMALGSSVWAASGTSSYGGVSGTSFSCPLSAGVAALVVGANPGVTSLQVNEAMRQTASRVNNPDREYGWGILDALKAINYPWIEHAPLTNTEDTTARTLVSRIKSRIALVPESTLVVYGVNGIFTGTALLTPTANPDEYTAQIPFMGTGVNVTYYLMAKNSSVSRRLPLNAPVQYYTYQVGQDNVGPILVHRSLGHQSFSGWPSRVSVSANDLSGIDTVKVEYFLNGVEQEPFVLTLMDTLGTYADNFPLAQSSVNPGDTISYRIIGVDRARNSNQTLYPSSGYIVFAILNYVNVSLSFDHAAGGFTGTNDWELGSPTGTSPPPYSGTKCWGTKLAANYSVGPLLSSLTTETYTVYSDRASFSFWHWYQIQSHFDGANVRVSINGGPFQIVHPLGGYTEPSIYNGFGNPLAAQPGFSGVGGTSWQKATLDVEGYALVGNTIAIRFDFGADNSIQYPGWYIDDFASDGFGFSGPTSADDGDHVPTRVHMEQNYPNPFNPSTTIRYAIPTSQHVSLKLFDVLGREIAVLVDELQDAGLHGVTLQSADFSTGVYFYRLQTGLFSETKKLLFLK